MRRISLISIAVVLLAAFAVAAPQDSPPQEKRAASPRSEKPWTPNPALLDPTLATEEAPEKFRVRFSTTEGDFTVEVSRKWAPHGADRFYNLVKIGFYDDTAFFRVLPGFVAQAGLHGEAKVNAAWRNATIPGDPILHPNTRGMVTFAMGGSPDSRTTQFFINYGDNTRLKDYGQFAPFGKVTEGMSVIEALYSGYGEGPPDGPGPDQGRITAHGNTYLRAEFPELDYIKQATVLKE